MFSSTTIAADIVQYLNAMDYKNEYKIFNIFDNVDLPIVFEAIHLIENRLKDICKVTYDLISQNWHSQKVIIHIIRK